MSRVVVVGAGVGGLAAAARLAANGHQVTVCERSDAVGGKLARFLRNGFTFDTGPSLLTMPHVFRDLFADTGAPLSRVLDLELVDPTARYRFADGTWLDAVASRDQLYTVLDDVLTPGSGQQWRAFLARAERMYAVTRGPFLESPIGGVGTLVRQGWRLDAVRTVAPWLTLRQLGQRHLDDPRLRMFLDRYATYTGSDPRRAPAALAVIPYVEQAFGGWYVGGGLYRLAEAICTRAVDRGAEVLLSAEVAAITTAAGRVDGVRLADGRVLPADVVVADVDARALYGSLVPDRRADVVRRRLAYVPASLAGFVLLLGLRGRTPDLAHHTVLFPADYDAELAAVFDDPAPVADPTIYVVAADDPAVRPDADTEGWFVLVNAPPHDPADGSAGVDWDAPGLAAAYADRVLAVLAGRGLDVRNRLLFRETRTPADLERATGSLGGSIYGPSSNGPRAAFLRPANRSPVPGLFLVGGSAHPGGGLPLVTLSAAIVARMIGPA